MRDSAGAVSRELLACYALVERLGRGVVYYGSARLRRNSPHWARARYGDMINAARRALLADSSRLWTALYKTGPIAIRGKFVASVAA